MRRQGKECPLVSGTERVSDSGGPFGLSPVCTFYIYFKKDPFLFGRKEVEIVIRITQEFMFDHVIQPLGSEASVLHTRQRPPALWSPSPPGCPTRAGAPSAPPPAGLASQRGNRLAPDAHDPSAISAPAAAAPLPAGALARGAGVGRTPS